MEKIMPLKRSKELTPLSHEHHDGLLFAWKINQGLDNNTSLETLCNYTRWFWANHIKPHFQDEEKVLIQFLPADNPMVKQMISEHIQIRDLVISLDKEPDNSTLKILSEFLTKHIRFEERELFPYVETTLTEEQLNSIYQQLAKEPICETEWKEEFWVKKK
jgi:hemerythrin-like domain-containing protein